MSDEKMKTTPRSTLSEQSMKEQKEPPLTNQLDDISLPSDTLLEKYREIGSMCAHRDNGDDDLVF